MESKSDSSGEEYDPDFILGSDIIETPQSQSQNSEYFSTNKNENVFIFSQTNREKSQESPVKSETQEFIFKSPILNVHLQSTPDSSKNLFEEPQDILNSQKEILVSKQDLEKIFESDFSQDSEVENYKYSLDLDFEFHSQDEETSQNKSIDDKSLELASKSSSLIKKDKNLIKTLTPPSEKDCSSNVPKVLKDREVRSMSPLMNLTKNLLQSTDSIIEVCSDSVNNHPVSCHPGFSTVSGKKIFFSDSSMIKAKNLFEPIGSLFERENQTVKFNIKNKITHSVDKTNNVCELKDGPALKQKLDESIQDCFLGFSTVSGKQIRYSKSSMDKAKSLLGPINLHIKPALELKDEGLPSVTGVIAENQCLPCLSTVSGKRIMCSKSDQAKNLLEYTNVQNDPIQKLEEKSLVDRGLECLPDFSTFSGKKTEYSKSSTEKANRLLGEIGCNNKLPFKVEKQEVPSVTCTINEGRCLPGFSAVSGKKIMCSKSSIDKAKSFLELNNLQNDSVPIKDLKELLFTNKELENLPGFSTVSGKQIEYSKSSMDKAKNLLGSINLNIKQTSELQKGELSSVTGISNKDKCLPGFSTVSGKKIMCSKSSIDKAKKLLNNLQDNSNINLSVIGFSSASGKKITFSKSSIDKAKHLFDLDNPDQDEMPIDRKQNCFSGFSTGLGKKIEYSKSSMDKAKHLLGSIDLNDESKLEPNKPNSCNNPSLSAISEKQIHFSKSSIDRANNPLNINDSNPRFFTKLTQDNLFSDNNIPEQTSFISGFSTVSGKSITYSKTSINKAKSLLISDDSDQNSFNFYSSSKIDRPQSAKNSNVDVVSLDPSNDKRSSEKADIKICVTEKCNNPKFRVSIDLQSSSEIKNNLVELNPEASFNDFDFSQNSQFQESMNSDILTELDEAEKSHFHQKRPSMEESGGPHKKIKIDEDERLQLIRDQKEKIRCNNFLKKLGYISNLRSINPTSKLSDIGSPMLTSNNYFKYYDKKEAFIFENVYNFIYVSEEETMIIPSSEGKIGIEEFRNALCSIPSVQASKVSFKWISNHYRWIITYLIGLENKNLINGVLQPRSVLLLLRRRYDVEFIQGRRSALKKIYEGDDSPSKPMILFVASIFQDTMELSDGWYSIAAPISSEAWKDLIESGKVAIGTKLFIINAELSAGAKPADPLESDSTTLKVSVNSSRRARWDCLLGYCRSSINVFIPKLEHLKSESSVHQIGVTLMRVYPMIYMTKKSDKIYYVSEKVYEKSRVSRERSDEELIEQLCSQAKKEYEDNKKKEKPNVKLKKMNSRMSVEDLNACIDDDPTLAETLTETQLQEIWNYRESEKQKMEDYVRSEVQSKISLSKTEFIPILRLKVCDESEYYGTLSIWRPDPELVKDLTESSRILIGPLYVKSLRKKEVLLSSLKSTKFDFNYAKSSTKKTKFKIRSLTSIFDFLNGDFDPTIHFHEADIIGQIIRIDDTKSPDGFQNIYLCDSLKNFVRIKFWSSILEYSLDSAVSMESVIYFRNLSWRASSFSSSIPSLYVTEHTEAFRDFKDPTITEMMLELKSFPEGDFEECKRILTDLLSTVTPVRKSSLKPKIGITPSLVSPTFNATPGSPAAFQSARNKKKMALLDNVSYPDGTLTPLPPELPRRSLPYKRPNRTKLF